MDSEPYSAQRGPYAGRCRTGTEGRPSVALAANVRAYRILRHMTQDELGLRMTDLGHDWGRSTVSAVERSNRNVTTDELFGLALCFGATIGGLLDPTGPDHSRNLSFDVGLDSPLLIEPGVSFGERVASSCGSGTRTGMRTRPMSRTTPRSLRALARTFR